jgi:hypothetical protein
MTNGADGSVTSSRITGKKCSSALRRIPIRPPLSYSSSSRLDTQAVTAKDNCIPFRSESESGGSRPSSGLLVSQSGAESCLNPGLTGPPVTLMRHPVTKLRE